MTSIKRPCMLVILDGWGMNPASAGNAVAAANTPNLDRLFDQYPHTGLVCSGEAVGLPPGFMGNSEVGHLNIGAGRIVYQELMKINLAIEDGSFFSNKTLSTVMASVQSTKGVLHLMGLVSDGGVHSHINHLKALIKMGHEKGIQVRIHAILDGRDTPPDSGSNYIADLEGFLSSYDNARIATVCGRYYAMDRDTRWDRTEKAYRLYTLGEGTEAPDAVAAVEQAYANNETDEFVTPFTITGDTINDNDGVVFFNFRADRARQIVRAFTDPGFQEFDRKKQPALSGFVCMTLYDKTYTVPVAFPPENPARTLGEVISGTGRAQLRIAETEKYAHVTYFFNGGIETPFPGEDRKLIPSPRDVATYDKKPEMSAHEVAAELVAGIEQRDYALIVVNFANMDMVGHTGIFDAAVKACETVDECVGQIIPAFLKTGGAALVTADHGNAELMTAENGTPHTAHTKNQVPLILVDDSRKNGSLSPGKLGDIAPTILALMGLAPPAEMTGASLLDGGTQ